MGEKKVQAILGNNKLGFAGQIGDTKNTDTREGNCKPLLSNFSSQGSVGSVRETRRREENLAATVSTSFKFPHT